ncbi:MAG: hypothetical protein ACOY42_11995 [Pseudomonadota bacterium]|jgi:hypothetical protein
MPPVPDRGPVPLLFEPELLPLVRAYGYLRLAGVAPGAAAAAVARLQAAIAGDLAGGRDWRRQLLADPSWMGRRTVSVSLPPPLSGRWQRPVDGRAG